MGKKLKKAEVDVSRLLDMVESISAERDEWRDAADEQDTLLGKANADKKECEHELVSLRHTLDDLVGIQRNRVEAAEARVGELEKELSAAVEQKIHAIFNLGRCKALLNTANFKLERASNV